MAVGESEPHHEIIERNANTESRKQSECRTDNTLENGHETRLHTHINKVACREGESLLGIRIAMEGKDAGEDEVGDETDCVAYQRGDYSRNLDGVYEHHIYTILEQGAETADEGESEHLSPLPAILDKFLYFHSFMVRFQFGFGKNVE